MNLSAGEGFSARPATHVSVAVAVALLAFVATSRSVLAQPSGSAVGPGARVRVTISSALTARELSAMVGADESVTPVVSGERTIILQTRQGLELVLPAPGSVFAGVVLAVDEQAVSIKADRLSRSLTVPRAAIAKLERADGRRSRARYAGFGALIGLGGGGLAGLVSAVSCEPGDWFCSASLNAVAGAILGAGGGAVVGALIPPAVRWSPVDVVALSGTPQPPPVASKPRRPARIAITVQTGRPSSGPAPDIEDAMRVSGLADTSPAFFGDPIAHPFSRTGFWAIGTPVVVEVDYRLRPSWSVGFVASRTPIGETSGHRSTGFQFLDLQYGVTTTGLMLSRDYRAFRLGAGPALHTARVREITSGRDGSWAGWSRVGIVALAGGRFPTDTPVYLDVSVQYRYLGRAPFGPFTSSTFPGVPATVVASEAQFSHWFIAFGPGIRF